MYVVNVIDDYNNITIDNCTDILNGYDNNTISICTNNESDTDKIIPSLLLTIPCGLSFLCMLSLMVYTSIKPLLNNK